ncbi:MAG: hypothetical protein H0T17_04215 [Propionibacteriales bacterium]|nr:hypothetical protein [Propionibacteriales bacterium]
MPAAGGSHRELPLAPPADETVVIDCDRCTMRGIGCGDCVVTVLLGGPPYGVELNDDERNAIDVLSQAGLVPPLRMVEPVASPLIEEV